MLMIITISWGVDYEQSNTRRDFLITKAEIPTFLSPNYTRMQCSSQAYRVMYSLYISAGMIKQGDIHCSSLSIFKLKTITRNSSHSAILCLESLFLTEILIQELFSLNFTDLSQCLII